MKSVKEMQFVELLDCYKGLVVKVCYFYSSDSAPFGDLYQEVVMNLWQGMESFRGEAKFSTWIYRTAINTCITWHRRTRKMRNNVRLDELSVDLVVDESDRGKELRAMYGLISRLSPVEKAIVTMWLDENSYEEIASVLGISRANVAVKLHRIKEKLARMAENIDV